MRQFITDFSVGKPADEHAAAYILYDWLYNKKGWYNYEEITSRLKDITGRLLPRDNYTLTGYSVNMEIIKDRHEKYNIEMYIKLDEGKEEQILRIGEAMTINVVLEVKFVWLPDGRLEYEVLDFELKKTSFKGWVSIKPTSDYSKMPNIDFKDIDGFLADIVRLRGFWYRGHAEMGFPLQSKISREKEGEAFSKFQKNYMEKILVPGPVMPPELRFEKDLKKEFVNRAGFLHPELHSADVEKCCFLMQHHNIPTRLLDWSSLPWVGLYFAICDERHDDKDGELFILHPDKLNEHQKIMPIPSNIKNLFESMEELIVAFEPAYINLRMIKQEAKFTLHASREPLEEHDSYLRKIKIPKKAKPKLRKRLKEFGCTRSKLFPDLDNIALEIKENFGIKS